VESRRGGGGTVDAKRQKKRSRRGRRSRRGGGAVAGKFDGSSIDRLHIYQTLSGFFQHGGVSISTFIGWINQVLLHSRRMGFVPMPIRAAGGVALDSGSGDELQPGRHVIRTLPPGVFSMLGYYRLLIQRIRGGSEYGIPDHGRTPYEGVLCQL
jgi:hypothetical protein